jgi:hypothetical protein
MPGTYEKIATQTTSNGNTSITFSSISGYYTDLVLIVSVKGNASLNLGMRFNSDTGTNYSSTYMYSDGTNVGSGRYTTQDFIRLSNYTEISDTNYDIKIININNYSNATTDKTALTIARTAVNPTTAGIEQYVGLWRNTNAITAIEVYVRNSSYAAGGTLTLYGIKAA